MIARRASLMCVSLCCCIVGVALLASPAAAADDGPLAGFSAKQQKRLLAGKAVFGHVRGKGEQDRGSGRAAVIVDATVEECFAVFDQLDKQYLYFPRKVVSEVVATAGNQRWVRTEVDFTLKRIEYTVRYTVDRARHRFEFALDKSYPHDIAALSGYFSFDEVEPGRTLLTYVALELDSGMAVPDCVRKWVTKRDLPAQVVNVKRRIESGGTWTK
jgi:hypothetical protein